ncbi:substrate-binding periplasmic protein [Undibacterium sp. Dicai25W]|uniref:substrate-binding periplasmic protein n=1 Tax=Undibacterium sp. Dicai25W TaxID=3413034 RepID=UPI003BF2986D
MDNVRISERALEYTLNGSASSLKKTLRGILFQSLLFVAGLVFGNPVVAAEQRPLTVVFAEGLEPLCWEEGGKAMGEQPEIAEYVLAKLGIKAKFLFLPWARAQWMIKEGTADLMMTTPTKNRFDYAVFGKEMTTPNYWNVFVRKDDSELVKKTKNFTTLDDLKPYPILDFFGNGWTEAHLKESDGFKVHKAAKMQDIVRLMGMGQGSLTINSSTSMNWFLNKLHMTDVIEEIALETPETRFQMVFQVSRKSPWMQKGLVKSLDAELQKMKLNGEWLKVLKKYKDPYGTGAPFKAYAQAEEFYQDYDRYPIFKPDF